MEREEPSLSASGFFARLRFLISRGAVTPLLSALVAFAGFTVASFSFTIQQRQDAEESLRRKTELSMAQYRALQSQRVAVESEARARSSARALSEVADELAVTTRLVDNLPASEQKSELAYRLGRISGLLQALGRNPAPPSSQDSHGTAKGGAILPSYLSEGSRNIAGPTLIPAANGIDPAAAAPAAVATPRDVMSSSIKLYIVLAIFGVLGITFLGAVAAVFTTKIEKAFAFATDTIKTLLGFFIGVITTFMGIPAGG